MAFQVTKGSLVFLVLEGNLGEKGIKVTVLGLQTPAYLDLMVCQAKAVQEIAKEMASLLLLLQST